MADHFLGLDAPQFVPPQDPWHVDSQATIFSGLHVREDWSQHLYSSPSDLGESPASDRVPAWLEHKIVELLKSSPSCNDALIERVLGALNDQDLRDLEQRGCSCGVQHSTSPYSSSGSCSWCRAKVRLGNVKHFGSIIKRALSNAGKHLRHRKSSDVPPSPTYDWASDMHTPLSPTGSRVPVSKAYSFPPNQVPATYTDYMAELPADLSFGAHVQDNKVPAVPYSDWSQAAGPSELATAETLRPAAAAFSSPQTTVPYRWHPVYNNGARDAASDRPWTQVSAMSGSSVSTRPRGSQVSSTSRSTTQTDLTRISTDQSFFAGGEILQSPTEMNDVSPLKVDDWSDRQGSSSSLASTHLDYPSELPGEGKKAWTSHNEAEVPFHSTSPNPPPVTGDAYTEFSPLHELPSTQDFTFVQESPPPYTVLSQHPTWDRNAPQPPVYSPPMHPQPHQTVVGFTPLHTQPHHAGDGFWDGIYDDPDASAPGHTTSHNQMDDIFHGDHHNIGPYPPVYTPTDSFSPPGALLNMESSELRLPMTFSQPAAAVSLDAHAYVMGGGPTQTAPTPQLISAIDTLPSVQRSQQPRRPELKRNNRTSDTRHCCGKEFKGSGTAKKLKRHQKSDEHRRKQNQEVLERVPCGMPNANGTICDRKFQASRLDNLQQHRKKVHKEVMRSQSEGGRGNG